MAEPSTPDAAETIPTPSQDSNDVGLFVTTSLIGYIEPPLSVIAEIERIVRKLQSTTIPRGFLNDMIMLKLLAPTVSQDLMIYNIPEVAAIIAKLKDVLVVNYYQGAVNERTA